MVLQLPSFMASSNANNKDPQRPQQLKVSKSFSRAEPASPSRSSRNQRASTIQNGAVAEGPLSNQTNISKDKPLPKMQPDGVEEGSDDENTKLPEESGSKPLAGPEELPIELISLTDRCGIPKLLLLL